MYIHKYHTLHLKTLQAVLLGGDRGTVRDHCLLCIMIEVSLGKMRYNSYTEHEREVLQERNHCV